MEDTKQPCSTLRMRGRMFSLSLRPSAWYRMQVSNACKMVLLGDLVQHQGEAVPCSRCSLDF